MLRARSRAALYLVLIFLCGAFSSALGARWMERISVSADTSTSSSRPLETRNGAVKWFVKGLDLSPGQLDQLTEILQQTRSAYKEHELQIESIKQHARVRIREILTDQQQAVYDQLLADRARKEREAEERDSR